MAEVAEKKLSEVVLKHDDPMVMFREYIFPETRGKVHTLMDFAIKDIENDVIMRVYWKKIALSCDKMLSDYRSDKNVGIPRPSVCDVHMFGDSLKAYVFVFPPQDGGKDLSADELRREIESFGISYGILDANINRIADEKLYLKLIQIAEGDKAVPGTNGEIIDHYDREIKYEIDEDEQGVVDFKNINWLVKVNAGDVICDIKHATAGKDGKNVKGEVIHAVMGKMPPIPQGKNVSLTEDESALIADIDGHLFFRNGGFNVDEALVIEGDVGVKTGNLNVVGDIVIKGNVPDGYLVKATGNIAVEGFVSASMLICDGDVFIRHGMNGGGKGVIRAGGTVTCKFVEGCKVKAGGDVHLESVVNSTLRTDGGAFITSGKGTVIGGKLSAAKSIEAKYIGNDKNIQTSIDISFPQGFEQEYLRVRSNVNDLTVTLKTERSNREQFNQKKKMIELYADDKAALKRFLQTLPVIHEELDLYDLANELALAQKELDPMEEVWQACVQGTVSARKIFSNVHISICESNTIVRRSLSNAKFYLSKGRIIQGSR